MTWRIDDPQGNEAAKVRYDIVPYTRGVVLDLGCGPFKAFPHFIGVDNGHHDAAFGWQSRPDIVVDTCARLAGKMTLGATEALGLLPEGAVYVPDYTYTVPDGSCDAVFSSHLLEHMEDPAAALEEWWRVLKVGGFLVLYLPDEDLYPRVGEPGANPDHKFNLSRAIVAAWMKRLPGWSLLENEQRAEGREYSFLQVYQKRDDGVHDVDAWDRARRTRAARKNACVVRYGGIGDMIQAASVFAAVKAQGYHVTLMTTPNGYEVVKHDPNVDAVMIQDTDQVPNSLLCEFWHVWSKKFDKFVNLSELVEGYLLGIPGRANHAFPEAVRRRYMGRNYLEFQHEVAETPFEPRPRFWPNLEECDRVAKWRAGLGEKAYVAMWALAGSSAHKVYPHMDAVIASALMKWPDLHWVLVGGLECQLLEAGWEGEPRVHRLCGRIGVRESLSLALGVDLVIGPETGITNAVAHEDVDKIVFLSHSSVENLTRDWTYTTSLTPPPEAAPCYPCHRLHYDRTFCPEVKMPLTEFCPTIDALPAEQQEILRAATDEHGLYSTGGALCAHWIDPVTVVEAIGSARLAAFERRLRA